MIAIVDYGVGNLFSLKSSLDKIGAEGVIARDEKTLINAEKIILPGVGAFRDAIEKLRQTGFDNTLYKEVKKGKPIMGICLGMQMLFSKSYEYGEYEGLDLIKGNVKPLKGDIPENFKIPHIGWNSLQFKKESPIFKYINNGDYVYFVHSYYAGDCDKNVIASTDYGTEITAAVQNDNVFGCQFHPEKSGETGLKILKAFCDTE